MKKQYETIKCTFSACNQEEEFQVAKRGKIFPQKNLLSFVGNTEEKV